MGKNKTIIKALANANASLEVQRDNNHRILNKALDRIIELEQANVDLQTQYDEQESLSVQLREEIKMTIVKSNAIHQSLQIRIKYLEAQLNR